LDHQKNRSKLNCFIVYSSVSHVSYINNVLYYIRNYLTDYNINPLFLGEEITSTEDYLFKLKENISKSDFAIVILDGFRPNILFEFGMLIHANVKILLLKEEKAQISIKTLYDDISSSGLTPAKFEDLKNPILNVPLHFSDFAGKNYKEYSKMNLQGLNLLFDKEIPKITHDVLETQLKEANFEQGIDLTKLARELVDLSRKEILENKIDNALEKLLQAKKIFEKANSDISINLVNSYLIQVYKRKEDIPKTIDLIKESIEICKFTYDYPAMANNLLFLGDIYVNNQNYSLGKESLLKAKKLYELLDNSMGISRVLLSLGIYYKIMKQYKTSIYCFNQSL